MEVLFKVWETGEREYLNFFESNSLEQPKRSIQ